MLLPSEQLPKHNTKCRMICKLWSHNLHIWSCGHVRRKQLSFIYGVKNKQSCKVRFTEIIPSTCITEHRSINLLSPFRVKLSFMKTFRHQHDILYQYFKKLRWEWPHILHVSSIWVKKIHVFNLRAIATLVLPDTDKSVLILVYVLMTNCLHGTEAF